MFYNELRDRYLNERDSLKASTVNVIQSAVCSRQSVAKINRQQVYLDYEKCEEARELSRRHLYRHRDWLVGPTKYDDVALQDIMAVQHFIDMDIEDLFAPQTAQRHYDNFGGANGDISEQFLLDAPRSSLKIGGRRFNFMTRLSRQPAAAREDPGQVQALRQAFLADITRALLRTLGESPAPALVRAVTSVMSQSGLASVERACYSSQVISGCSRRVVSYKLLSRSSSGPWEVALCVRKSGFEQCKICSQNFEDSETIDCALESFVLKACSVLFLPGSKVEADVFKFHKVVRLVNDYGSLITGHALDADDSDGLYEKLMDEDSDVEADDDVEDDACAADQVAQDL